MKSLWNQKEASKFAKDDLDLRVYTSRLLGKDSNLVLHGGGNTSVKSTTMNIFKEKQDVLYVKGSGWDLATIERAGFAPVLMESLLKMAELKKMTDSQMVAAQRSAMTNPDAPNPSVEAILHAIIPFKFVDHTHADSVVAISNTPKGKSRIQEIYGDSVLIIDYVMPGFILAKEVYRQIKDIDLKKYEGMILMNHGVFTFDDDARKSYEKMIKIINKAEKYLNGKKLSLQEKKAPKKIDLQMVAQTRKVVSGHRGAAVLLRVDDKEKSVGFSSMKNVDQLATRGPLTPDHVIRTKPTAMIIKDGAEDSVNDFVHQYEKYFQKHAQKGLVCLEKSPRWAVWPHNGLMYFGQSEKELDIINDIIAHTIEAIQKAEQLEKWQALPAKDIFEMEYWELEQAKLKKKGSVKEYQGKVVLVTGAASGIGLACVNAFVEKGAAVVALDINKNVEKMSADQVFAMACDITDFRQVDQALEKTLKRWGGIDVVVSNAGVFPKGAAIENIDRKVWDKSLEVNLSSHFQLWQKCLPFLKYGIDPAIIVVASKNVPAPGFGAAAYSAAKAGLTQLARVAALEMAQHGIRVNMLHPNQIFDTAIWTKEILKNRAQHYRMSVEDYKKNNLLKTDITSKDVALLICTMAGRAFSKTTGAQVPIDGGNERVI